MSKYYYIYILTNRYNQVLYTGVTYDLSKRVNEHRQGAYDSFTKRYNINKLVYYEYTNNINFAIAREKQIKGGSRKSKLDLIKSINPEFKDLSLEFNV
ncbi:MAG TPA: GIY-YIG nuclease family protein [Ignavibacteriaceae bacterium]|nr:GIY-YIG nuclease family protein [Ignavibacteriaceae bacterium]